MVRVVGSRSFVLYVNLNILACSILFIAWAKPRETISGLMGRWATTEEGWKRGFAGAAAWMIDCLYWWDRDHCRENARQEAEARKALYP